MAQVRYQVPDFSQTSTFTGYRDDGGPYFSTPSTKSNTFSFGTSAIPAGSTIQSALLTTNYTSGLYGGTGRMNGVNSSSQVIAITAGQDTPITWTYKSGTGGDVSPSGVAHSSTCHWRNNFLDVTYTPPHTPPTVYNVTLDGYGGDQYKVPGATATLSWAGADGAYNPIQNYTIEYSENGGAYMPLVYGLTVTSYAVTAHAAGGSYYQYRVTALGVYTNGEGVSPKLHSYTAPAVSGVKLNGSTANQYKAPSSSVSLAWTGTAGANNSILRYAIYRNINGGAYTLLAEVTGTSHFVTAPGSVNERYQYYVIAIGERINSSAAYSPGLDTYTNPSVTNVMLASSASDQFRAPGAAVTLSWTGTNGVNNAIRSYNVSQSANGGSFSPLVSGVTGSNCSVSAHTLGGNYYTYQVEAVGEYTNSQQASSPKLFSYTAPTAPTSVTVSPSEVVPGGTASLSFSGATAPGGVSIASYSIFQATSPTGTYVYVGTSTSYTYSFTAPSANGHYYYKVQAIGSVSGYNSPQSAQYADLYVRKPKSTISIRQVRVPMDGVTAVTVDFGVNDLTYKHVLRWCSTDGVLRSDPLEIPAGITSAQITLPYAWNQHVPGESISAFADLTTIWGSTTIGADSCAFTAFVPESEKPKATLSVTLNDAFMSYALSGYTTATLNLSATFPLGAVPSNTDAYKIWGGGFNGASAQTYTTVPLSVGSYTFYGQATDSRTHKGIDEKTVVVTSYAPPMISDVNCFRANAITLEPDNDGTVIRIKAKFNVTSLEGNNIVAQATARYKQSGTGTWSDPVTLLSEQEKTLAAGIAVDQTYDVEIQLKDMVGKSAVPHSASVPASTRLFDFRKDRAALGRLAPSDNDKVLALPNDWDILHKGQTLDERFAGAGHNHPKASITDFTHTHPLGELTGVTPAAIGAAPTSHSQGASTVTAGTYPAGLFVFNTPAGMSGAVTGEVNTLQIKQATSGTDAFMTFHVSGDYAVHFGLDGSTNDLFCGGWSAGANKYRVFSERNLNPNDFLANRTNWSTRNVLYNVAGQMSWRNYGNGHTIFDASAALSPDGTTVDRTNSQNAWTANLPTLMGWNGSNTYGVRVDSARTADNLTGTLYHHVPAATAHEIIRGTIADNDYYRILAGGYSNAGYLEIATADDGTEPIYVRQYSGAFTSAVRTLTLLDEYGSTLIPGDIYPGGTMISTNKGFNKGSWNMPTLGAVTQVIDGSTAQHSVIVGRDSSGVRHYGVDLYDSTTNRIMRLYAGNGYLELSQSGQVVSSGDMYAVGEMYASAGKRVFHTGNTMFGPNLPGASYVGQVFFKTS